MWTAIVSMVGGLFKTIREAIRARRERRRAERERAAKWERMRAERLDKNPYK